MGHGCGNLVEGASWFFSRAAGSRVPNEEDISPLSSTAQEPPASSEDPRIPTVCQPHPDLGPRLLGPGACRSRDDVASWDASLTGGVRPPLRQTSSRRAAAGRPGKTCAVTAPEPRSWQRLGFLQPEPPGLRPLVPTRRASAGEPTGRAALGHCPSPPVGPCPVSPPSEGTPEGQSASGTRCCPGPTPPPVSSPRLEPFWNRTGGFGSSGRGTAVFARRRCSPVQAEPAGPREGSTPLVSVQTLLLLLLRSGAQVGNHRLLW